MVTETNKLAALYLKLRFSKTSNFLESSQSEHSAFVLFSKPIVNKLLTNL